MINYCELCANPTPSWVCDHGDVICTYCYHAYGCECE